MGRTSGATEPARGALTMQGELTPERVRTICGLHDDIYRNHWITYAYHRISERMRPHVASHYREDGVPKVVENATWCTFARWSSFTVGEALDPDLPNRRLEQVIDRWPMRYFKDRLRRLNKDLHLLSDAAMPRTLGIGNHYVFHDIGYAMTCFLEWYEETHPNITPTDDTAWTREWERFRTTLAHGVTRENDFFQAADIEWLENGLFSYLEAMRCPDDSAAGRARKSELVLRGNVMLAVYEQWRLDPILKIALDPVARNFVEFQSASPHAPADRTKAVLKRRGTPYALRRRSQMGQWLADQYGQVITRWWLAYEAPIASKRIQLLLVGEDIDVDEPAFPGNRRLRDSELLKILSIFDRDRRLGSGSSWTRFADRMQFIVDLFRAEQFDVRLHDGGHLNEHILRLDVSTHHLDELRHKGDPPMDNYVTDHLGSDGVSSDPREFVQHLIAKGLRTDFGDGPAPSALDGSLPEWARDFEKLADGQDFLLEHGLQIAAALFNASLPKSYTVAHGTKVLMATAELASGQVNRRVAETGQLLLDLMPNDDEFDRGLDPLTERTRASESLRGVRLFHAAVRQMLERRGWNPGPEPDEPVLEHGDGDEHDDHRARDDRRLPPRPSPLGVPINQEDLLGTLMAFTLVVFDALDEMGSPVEGDDRKAYLYLWQVAGYLLGIDYSLFRRPEDTAESQRHLPPDEHELRTIGRAIYARNAASGPDGTALSASLMHMMGSTLRGPMKLLPPTATRWLIGDEAANLLDVPPSEAPIRAALWMARPFTRLLSGHYVGQKASGVMEQATLSTYHQWIDTYQGDRAPWRTEPVDDVWDLPRRRRPHPWPRDRREVRP